jgi:hypothetical protein
VIVAPGEVEQPEPVADRERVEVKRVASVGAPVTVHLIHLGSTIPSRWRGRRNGGGGIPPSRTLIRVTGAGEAGPNAMADE